MPRSSRFGRAFANFWLLVETGEVAGDCQSGFRAYPVASLNRMRFLGKRYDFEAEVLARAAWGGLKLHCVDIGVLYPKPEERVSSFKPLLDNLRLTRIHTLLVLRNMLPLGHGSLMTGAGLSPWRHPLRTLETLCSGKVTALTLARSMAAGMLVGVLPVLFLYPLIATVSGGAVSVATTLRCGRPGGSVCPGSCRCSACRLATDYTMGGG